MKKTIEAALKKSISFEQYNSLFESLVAEGKTTGPNQSEGYVGFTKLNWSRYKRALKQVELSQQTRQVLSSLKESITLLIITEAWCGDASQVLPVIELISEAAPKITSKLVLRDEHEELMNQFLTNGGKSIPKVIVLDEEKNVLASWGPRPSVLQKQVVAYKTENPTATGMDVSGLVQKWYNEDKGQTTQNEIISLINKQIHLTVG